MALLLDTQIIVWVGTDDRRLRPPVKAAIADPDAVLLVSAVIAYEFEDLRARGRLGLIEPIGSLLSRLEAMVVDFPADAYRLVPLLPTDIHRDPVDRMLIAHALHADLTIVTADADIRRYPVRTLW